MIRVLVVEDEPVAAEAHRQYVLRVPGFTVAGVVHSGGAAVRFLERSLLEHDRVDLLLLDLNLPDIHGLQVCRAVRAAGYPVDVIAVTSARDLAMVRSAVSVGAVQYLLKPFTFAALRDKLERYLRFRRSVADPRDAAGQDEVDRALATLRSPDEAAVPKGMNGATLTAVTAALRDADAGLSAEAVAGVVGVSRVTARRYLEHLVDTGLAARTPKYGQVGRPELWYRWSADPPSGMVRA